MTEFAPAPIQIGTIARVDGEPYLSVELVALLDGRRRVRLTAHSRTMPGGRHIDIAPPVLARLAALLTAADAHERTLPRVRRPAPEGDLRLPRRPDHGGSR